MELKFEPPNKFYKEIWGEIVEYTFVKREFVNLSNSHFFLYERSNGASKTVSVKFPKDFDKYQEEFVKSLKCDDCFISKFDLITTLITRQLNLCEMYETNLNYHKELLENFKTELSTIDGTK